MPEGAPSVSEIGDWQAVTFFLGAGVSGPYGVPGWDDFVVRLYLHSMGLNHLKGFGGNHDEEKARLERVYGPDKVRMARMVWDRFSDSKHRRSSLTEVLYGRPSASIVAPTALQEIANWPNRTGRPVSFITYNYDELLERELSAVGVPHFSVYDETTAEESKHLSAAKTIVFHVHGFLPKEEEVGEHSIVLSERQYNELCCSGLTASSENLDWRNRVQLEALRSSTCLFLGTSLDDPNTRRLLDFVQSRGNDRFIFRKGAAATEVRGIPPEVARDIAQAWSDPYSDWHLALARFQAGTKVLSQNDDHSFGLRQILLDDYPDIPPKLAEYRQILQKRRGT